MIIWLGLQCFQRDFSEAEISMTYIIVEHNGVAVQTPAPIPLTTGVVYKQIFVVSSNKSDGQSMDYMESSQYTYKRQLTIDVHGSESKPAVLHRFCKDVLDDPSAMHISSDLNFSPQPEGASAVIVAYHGEKDTHLNNT